MHTSELRDIMSSSGRNFPRGTQVELYFMGLPNMVGVKLKLPKARSFVDLGPQVINDASLKLPLRLAFLAYSREDKVIVNGLCQTLLEAGVLPWIDTRDLYGGQKWRLFRDKALREADHCVLFLSSRCVSRIGEFQREIKLAIEEVARRPEESNYLIPVKLDTCELPLSLREFHCIELDKFMILRH